MERVGEHPVPAGPLAVRWLAYDLPALRAGAPTRIPVELRNVGLAAWQPGTALSYHWLDDHGNALVWDGWRTELPTPVAPDHTVRVDTNVRVPMPPGRYRLAFDLVDDSRYWFGEVGSFVLTVPATVQERVRRRLAVRVVGGADAETERALVAQEEPLVDEPDADAVAHLVGGALPDPDWSRRVLDAHAEGFAVVGGAIEGPEAEYGAWAPTPGRNPAFSAPLLLPSLVRPLEPTTHLGLPAWAPDPKLVAYDEEPWVFDGRIRLRLPRGRRRA
jgi:hypothetical protein